MLQACHGYLMCNPARLLTAGNGDTCRTYSALHYSQQKMRSAPSLCAVVLRMGIHSLIHSFIHSTIILFNHTEHLSIKKQRVQVLLQIKSGERVNKTTVRQ